MSVSIEAIKEAEQRRLTWRCRRGMLELDIVLQRFMAQHFYTLTIDELAEFDVLLAMPDNDFWNLLVNKETSIEDPETKKVILKIQSMHRER